MSELTISSTRWLAISLRNSSAIVFHLDNVEQWQYLQAIQSNPPQPTNDDDDDSTTDLNRNLIRFSPNGQRLAVNGQNKQIFIYVLSTTTGWKLEKTIAIKKRASAFDLTDDFLLVADKSGDVYQVDLIKTFDQTEVTMTPDDCLMGHLSMLLDIVFVRPFIITADRDEKIRLSRYPNAYNIEGFCLGHTEFVSHVKQIDSNSILSASGDGTLRLWQIPQCIETHQLHTKTLISTSKPAAFSVVENSSENVELSLIDTSIWKMDVLRTPSDVQIAVAIHTSRNHSIYLTTLTHLKTNSGQSFQLTFDSQLGKILDFGFPSENANEANLYVLFDTNRLVRVQLDSLKISDDESLTKINTILQETEHHPVNNLMSKVLMFNQLFKNRGQPGDSSYYKRKNERIEQEEAKRAKKQAMRQVQSPDQ